MLLSFRDRSTTKRRKLSDTLTGEQRLEHLAETWAAHGSVVSAPPLVLLGTDRTLRREAADRIIIMTTSSSSSSSSSNKDVAAAAPTTEKGSDEEKNKDDDADKKVKEETKESSTPKEEAKESSAERATTATATTGANNTKTPKKSSSSSSSSIVTSAQFLIDKDVARYQELQKQEQDELDAIQAKRQQLKREQVELWGVYTYGLEKIAGLPDLGVAPDAILPGNF
jgi:hypothetical protein